MWSTVDFTDPARPSDLTRIEFERNPPFEDLLQQDRHALVASLARHYGPVVASWPADAFGTEIVQFVRTDRVPLIHALTLGTSDRPMNAPAGQPSFIELVCTLPPAWRLDAVALADDGWAWPLRWLRMLAVYPAQTNGWLGKGHTLPCVDRPCGFDALAILPPLTLGAAITDLPLLPSGKRVELLAVYPIYERERQFAMANGSTALWERLVDGPMDIVEPGRSPVC